MSRSRLAATLTLVVAIAIVVGIVLATSPSPSGPSNASAATSNRSGGTTVRRRNLVATDTEAGTLSYAGPHTVYDRLSGTVTWLPSVGQVIEPGQALFRVDNEPVPLMDGSTPAYRNLGPSDTAGPDIAELNRNLVDLGYAGGGITIDGSWQADTTTGVRELQAALGEPETGTLTLGQIVFLPGPQLIGTVNGTVGSAASLVAPASHAEFVDFTPTTSTSTTSYAIKPPSTHGSGSLSLAALMALLRAETAQLQAAIAAAHAPSRSNSGSSSPKSSGSAPRSGNSGGAGTAILQTTSTKLVVTVDLNATLQNEATLGEHVTVEMPSGGTMNGRVTAVSSVAQSSAGGSGGNGGNGSGGNGNGGGNGNSSGATVPVTITLQGRPRGAGLDQAAVSVNFAQAKAFHVLSVPVTALIAVSGGNYAVQTAAAPHRLIPVTTGLFAAGYVQISGTGIYPGLQVTDSQG